MIGTAWAAGAEGAHEGIFSDPTLWIAVAFVLFFVATGRIMWRALTGALDKRSAMIAQELSEAERLRAEALEAKTAAERTLAEATAEADGIIGQARDEAQRMQARAATNLETAVAMREQQALERIAQSEAAATKQVRDTAVDVALSATRALLREQVGAGRTESLINEAIGELPRRLH